MAEHQNRGHVGQDRGATAPGQTCGRALRVKYGSREEVIPYLGFRDQSKAWLWTHPSNTAGDVFEMQILIQEVWEELRYSQQPTIYCPEKQESNPELTTRRVVENG